MWCSRKRDLVRIAFCFLGNRWDLVKRQLPVPTMSTYPCPALHPCRNFLGSLPPSQPASSGPCCPVMCMIVSLSVLPQIPASSDSALVFLFTRLPCEVSLKEIFANDVLSAPFLRVTTEQGSLAVFSFLKKRRSCYRKQQDRGFSNSWKFEVTPGGISARR